MSYNPNIPGPNDLLSQSQGQIQTNFSQLSTWTAVDHIGVTTPTNTGEHLQVTIPSVQSAPSPTGSVGIITTQTAGGKSELFYTNATANVQLSDTSLSASSGAGLLPGGLQIRSGSSSSSSLSFSSSFPTACVAMTATWKTNPGGTLLVTSVSASGATVSNAGAVYFYIAVGY